MQKFEMQFNEVYDLGQKQIVPLTKIIISDEIKVFIECFADIQRDEKGETIYIINKLRFKIAPHFEQNKSDDAVFNKEFNLP